MEISQRLAAIRKEMKLSQEKFGELVNMSQRSVAAWESGDRLPSYPVLTELADKLDVSVDYLLGRTDNKRGDPKNGQKEKPAEDIDGLRESTLTRIMALPEPALQKLLDLVDTLQACQARGSDAPAAPDPSGPASSE